MILGIDTSAGQCAVAVISGDTLIARAAEPMAKGHAERLFPLIETALAESGLGVEGLRRIAVCTGPGSFTGLRVGVAAARGLAMGRGLPAIGVTRFEAIAAQIARPRRLNCDRLGVAIGLPEDAAAPARSEPRALEAKIGWAERRPIALALAGGRGGVALQAFAPDLAPLSEPTALAPDALVDAAPEGVVRAGDGWALAGLDADLAPEGLADPAVVAASGATRTQGPLPGPLYLRDADAELPREAAPRLLD
ncbi:MAG: tRNA (adenosine(37)-N6)-threonylcarbamoyltransferase complex dimerization subunit type 1 TsaB [Paracoccaceae bacterium]